jgi:hypothetical protein
MMMHLFKVEVVIQILKKAAKLASEAEARRREAVLVQSSYLAPGTPASF